MSLKKSQFRIVVIDDHPVLRQGIAQLIRQEKDFEVVGEADDTKKAISLVQETKPDGIVLDVSLRGASGIEAAKDIRHFSRC